MVECERLFGQTQGRLICEMIEDSLGHACPCKAGRVCPLIAGPLVSLEIPAVPPMP